MAGRLKKHLKGKLDRTGENSKGNKKPRAPGLAGMAKGPKPIVTSCDRAIEHCSCSLTHHWSIED